MRICYTYLVLFFMTFGFFSSTATAQDGATLFNKNCAACHKLGMRLVGPDLIGVGERRSEEWLLQFIQSSQAFIKSGDPDAVAIFEEYNQMIMTDQPLSDDEVRDVLAYIKSESPSSESQAASEEPAEAAEPIVIEYTEEDVQAGLALFSGQQRFSENGPSCISCHHVNNDQLITGGLLAKDLTNVYERMGDAGIAGILGAPPFPAMTVAYQDNALDSLEIVQLTAFLKHADGVSGDQQVRSGAGIFILGGSGGLIVLFLLIALHWKRRLKTTVKHDIYKRQLKGSDSII